MQSIVLFVGIKEGSAAEGMMGVAADGSDGGQDGCRLLLGKQIKRRIVAAAANPSDDVVNVKLIISQCSFSCSSK